MSGRSTACPSTILASFRLRRASLHGDHQSDKWHRYGLNSHTEMRQDAGARFAAGPSCMP
jgi:hypothetical protein